MSDHMREHLQPAGTGSAAGEAGHHDGHHDGHRGGDQGGGHQHGIGAGADRRYLLIALVLLVGFMATEVVVAVLSGSLALLSDAGHMLSDVGAIAGALWAIRLAARPAGGAWTFGWKRAEIISAAGNGITLLLRPHHQPPLHPVSPLVFVRLRVARSPSQCPAVFLVSISAGRWSIIVMFVTAPPAPFRVSQRDLRILRPVRSEEQ